MLPYFPRYSDRSSLPGWPAMSGKRAGKPRYRLGVSQGGCGTGSVLRLGREWNRRFHEGPPSWLSEVATAARTRWRRFESSRWLATPGFDRIAKPRRRVRAGGRGLGCYQPLDGGQTHHASRQVAEERACDQMAAWQNHCNPHQGCCHRTRCHSDLDPAGWDRRHLPSTRLGLRLGSYIPNTRRSFPSGYTSVGRTPVVGVWLLASADAVLVGYRVSSQTASGASRHESRWHRDNSDYFHRPS